MFQEVLDESKRCLTTNYFNFNGRARRREFWGFNMLMVAALHVFVFLFAIASGEPAYEGDPVFTTGSYFVLGAMGIFALYVFIPLLSVSTRRLHDTGRSTWLLLIPLIPIASFIVLAVFGSLMHSLSGGEIYTVLILVVLIAIVVNTLFMVLKGTPGKNKYGESPKPPFVIKHVTISECKFDFKRTLLDRYAQFDGRARREEFWMFHLYYLLITIGIAMGTFVFDVLGLESLGDLTLNLWYTFIALPSFAVYSRRLHDTGRSLWLYLLVLIPIIGLIVLFIFLVLDSDTGENAYGHDPKALQRGLISNINQ